MIEIEAELARLEKVTGLHELDLRIVGGVAVSRLAPCVKLRGPGGLERDWIAQGTKDVDVVVVRERVEVLNDVMLRAGWQRLPVEGVPRYLRRAPRLILDCVTADASEDRPRHDFLERIAMHPGVADGHWRVARPAPLLAMKAVAHRDNASRKKDLSDLARLAIAAEQERSTVVELRALAESSEWLRERLARVAKAFEDPDAGPAFHVAEDALQSTFHDEFVEDWHAAVRLQVCDAIRRCVLPAL